MATNFVHDGSVIPYTAGGAIASGAVVLIGNMIGVALNAAAASGDIIQVKVDGVFDLTADSTDTFAVGELVIWDVSTTKFINAADTPATGDIVGGAICTEAKAGSVTTCRVKLLPGSGSVTS